MLLLLLSSSSSLSFNYYDHYYHFYYPRPVLAFGYCRCLRLSVCVSVRPCVNHELVRAITCHPFKLESPNLDHKCKTPWLRSLLFLGLIDLELQGQIKPKSNKLPHFELLRAIIHHLSQLGFPNLDQNCTLALLRSLLILAFMTLSFNFIYNFKSNFVPTWDKMLFASFLLYILQWDHRFQVTPHILVVWGDLKVYGFERSH